MIGAAYIFLIVPAHGIVIEQRDLHVEYVSSIDVYVIKFFGRTVSIVSKAGATDVSWIVVNVDDFVGLSCPRVFPSVQDLVRLRVEKEHDLARHHAVAIPPCWVSYSNTGSYVHALDVEKQSIRFTEDFTVNSAGPAEYRLFTVAQRALDFTVEFDVPPGELGAMSSA